MHSCGILNEVNLTSLELSSALQFATNVRGTHQQYNLTQYLASIAGYIFRVEIMYDMRTPFANEQQQIHLRH